MSQIYYYSICEKDKFTDDYTPLVLPPQKIIHIVLFKEAGQLVLQNHGKRNM